MRFSKTVDYMVRCVLFLAQGEPGAVTDRHRIVAATGVPDLYFRKIVQQLSRAGVIRTTRGPRGGYALATRPEDLTLLRVVEVGNGGICMNDCAVNPGACGRSGTCTVHRVWEDVRRTVRDALGAVTFAQLAQRDADNTATGMGTGDGADAPLERAASGRASSETGG
jgi:Rrf2 family protein